MRDRKQQRPRRAAATRHPRSGPRHIVARASDPHRALPLQIFDFVDVPGRSNCTRNAGLEALEMLYSSVPDQSRNSGGRTRYPSGISSIEQTLSAPRRRLFVTYAMCR